MQFVNACFHNAQKFQGFTFIKWLPLWFPNAQPEGLGPCTSLMPARLHFFPLPSCLKTDTVIGSWKALSVWATSSDHWCKLLGYFRPTWPLWATWVHGEFPIKEGMCFFSPHTHQKVWSPKIKTVNVRESAELCTFALDDSQADWSFPPPKERELGGYSWWEVWRREMGKLTLTQTENLRRNSARIMDTWWWNDATSRS